MSHGKQTVAYRLDDQRGAADRGASRGLLAVALFLLLSVAGPVGATEIPFSGRQVVAALNSARDAIAADIDGDGTLDVVGVGASGLSWWEKNEGAGPTWTEHQISSSPGLVSFIRAEDIDGDGDLDILGSLSGVVGGLSWWANTAGDGSAWTKQSIAAPLPQAESVQAADIDGDGDLDVAVSSSSEIAWWANTAGDGSAWTKNSVTSTFSGAFSVHVADIDGDGDLDIAGAAVVADDIAWWDNTTGAGTHWSKRSIDNNFNGAQSVHLADMDGDGDLDVLGAAGIADNIAWWENTEGDGSAWTIQTIVGSFDSPREVLAADLDGDGDLDVLGAAFQGDAIAWWENTAGEASAWTEHPIDSNFDGATSVFAGDLDGDGDLDVLGAASLGDEIAWWENETIHRSATFPEDTTVDNNFDGAHDITAADIDGDGDLDLVGAAQLANDITWWDNTAGDGSTWTKRTVDANFRGAISVRAVDMDGDGDLDVLGAAEVDNDISWWENTGGDGSAWTERVVDNNFNDARSVYAADLDGDGDLDVIGASFNVADVAWWENTAGDGTAWSKTLIDGNFFGAHSVFVADVDGDGDLDILGAARDASDISWWENTAGDASSWTERSVDSNFNGARSVFAADVDGDGDLDVLGAAEFADDIAWWENTAGNGSSWTKRTIDGSFDRPFAVRAADLDGDGDLDVVGAARNADDIAWWENTAGDASAWTEHTVDGSFDGAVSVATADVDGDGDLDILGAAISADDMTWWENRGGQFALPTSDVAPGRVADGATVAVLEIGFLHRGWTGEPSIELKTVELLLEDGAATPLDSAQANALVESLSVYQDDGSGVFEIGSDSVVSTVDTLGLIDGVLTVPIGDGGPSVVLPVGGIRTLFVVISFDTASSAAVPDELRVTHVTESSSTAEDAVHDIPLLLENSPNTSSGVIEVNDLPIALDDAVAGLEDAQTVGNVLDGSAGGLDSDEEGDAISAVLISGPTSGTLVGGLAANGGFTYEPNPNFNGFDSFTYAANDGAGNGNTATVTITVAAVNDLPTAVDDAVAGLEDVQIAGNVLDGSAGGLDSDIDGDVLSAVLISGPTHGSLVGGLAANGDFTYEPNPNFNGADSFTYAANDGTGNSNTATVTITVEAVNDLPVAVNDAVTGLEDAQIPGNVLDGSAGGLDSDVEGDALSAVLITGPSSGSLVSGLAANGVFTYEPNPDFNGVDSFTYAANDGAGNGNTATVTITVTAVNDLPVAVDDAVTGLEDAQIPGNVLDGSAGGLDSDVEGDTLSAVLISGPSNGSLVGGLAADGDFTYEPDADFNGVDSFTYAANDGTDDGNTATVTVTVDAVNDAPSFTLTTVAEADQDLGSQSFSGFASAISPGPADEAAQSLTFEVTDNSNPTLFSDGPAFTSDGTLTFTLASTDVGSAATVTFRLMDDGGTADGGVDVSPTQDFEIEVIDSVAPEITALASSGGLIEECTELRGATTSLVVTFSEAMANPAGNTAPEDITNPANFQLIGSGPDGDLTTLGCDALADDDVLFTPTAVTYDAVSFEATATLSPALGDGAYRLFVCDALQDVGGNPLLADTEVTFRQSASNPFSNSHFDCDLEGWMTVSSVSGEIEWSAEDVNDAAVSGSVRIADLSGGPLTIGQCVDLDPTRAGAQVRVDGPLDAGVSVMTTCEGFAGPSCSGASLGTHTATDVVLHTAGAWQPLTVMLANQGASSALCSFDLTRVAGTNFEAYLDVLSVSNVLFEDGFESGDTSQWSLVVVP